MKNYIYVVKKEFLKQDKDGNRKIENFGFVRFTNEEEEGEVIYAIPVKVNEESVLVRGLVADLNNKDWQNAANITDETQKEMFAKEGLSWEKQEDGSYKVIETQEMIDEFSNAFLCVSAEDNKTIPHGVLLLKGVDGIMRGATKTIETACIEAVKDLMNKGVIYKKKLNTRKKVKIDCRA